MSKSKGRSRSECVPVPKLVALMAKIKARQGTAGLQALADWLCGGSRPQLGKLALGYSKAGVETLTPAKLARLKRYGITYADMRPDLVVDR